MWPECDNSDDSGKEPVFDPGKSINSDWPKPSSFNPSISCFFDSLLETFAAPILLDNLIMSLGLTFPRYFQSLISLSSSLITPGAVFIIVDSVITLLCKPEYIINGKYAKDKHNALFVGILGDPEPKYVAAIIVRSPKNREGSGGFHAAPVFSEFMQHSMRILNDISYVDNR